MESSRDTPEKFGAQHDKFFAKLAEKTQFALARRKIPIKTQKSLLASITVSAPRR